MKLTGLKNLLKSELVRSLAREVVTAVVLKKLTKRK